MSLYGRLCNQIGDMKVIDPNVEEDKEKTTITFKKLIVSRCQTEFETNFQNVGACADPVSRVNHNFTLSKACLINWEQILSMKSKFNQRSS